MDSAEYLRLGPSRDNRAGHEDEDGSTVEFPAALSLSVSFSKHLVQLPINALSNALRGYPTHTPVGL